MNNWHRLGFCCWQPPAADWRPALARRLGQKPRRLGVWAELALAGALSCLDQAGEKTLPAKALLSLSSLSGPHAVLHDSLHGLASELPMPIAFLQSQPGQVLPVLAQHLGWSGDGRCLASREPLAALRLACGEADPAAGFLLGWVDETDGGRSVWLRAVAAPGDVVNGVAVAGLAELLQPGISRFGFTPGGELRVA